VRQLQNEKQQIVHEHVRKTIVRRTSNIGCRAWGLDDVKDDDVKFKFYTGLRYSQFLALWEFLGPAADKLVHWNRIQKGNIKTAGKSPTKCPGPSRKLAPQNELFRTLVRLRCGLLNKDLGYIFGISESCVSDIVTTWVQFLFFAV